MAKISARGDRSIHSPSRFKPADYIEIGDADLHETEGFRWRDPKYAAAPLFEGRYTERGECDHCGAPRLRYISELLHKPSGRVITVGWICAARFRFTDRDAWLTAQGRRAYAEKRRREVALERTLTDPEKGPLARRLLDYCDATEYPDEFLSSLCGSLNRHGDLSEKQWAALGPALERREQWDREKAERKAAEPQPSPCPTGDRLVIRGTVVHVKSVDSPYGSQLKMLVVADEGYRAWGTYPATIEGPDYTDSLKGKRIEFTAGLSPSDDDETFGFFRRPRKARLLTTMKEA